MHLFDPESFALFASGPHDAWLVVYMTVCVLSGVVIGAVGPGGVMLAPVLLMLDVPIDVAQPAVVSSCAFGGILTVVTQWRYVSPRRARLMCTAALPGALLGALIFPALPALSVSTLIALIAITCGTNIFIKSAWRWWSAWRMWSALVPAEVRLEHIHILPCSRSRSKRLSESSVASRSASPPTRRATAASPSHEPQSALEPSPPPPPRRPIALSASREGLTDALPQLPRHATSCCGADDHASPSATSLTRSVGNALAAASQHVSIAVDASVVATTSAHTHDGEVERPPPVSPSCVAVAIHGLDAGDAADDAPAARPQRGVHADDEYHDQFPVWHVPRPCGCGTLEVPKVAFHAAVGFAAGLLSLLTATGGPMVALPLFFRFYPRLAPVRALVLAQSLTVPNGLAAFLVAAARGHFDVGLAVATGVAVSCGIPIGAAVARRLKPRLLRGLVGAMLVCVGVLALAKVVIHAVTPRHGATASAASNATAAMYL